MVSKLPGILIIDASILFSFFKRDSFRAQLLEKLPFRGTLLIVPDFALKELFDGRRKIMKFSSIDELEFLFIFSYLVRLVNPVRKKQYESFLSEANNISPHGEDTKDDPYFALALSFNCGIWSDEHAFKKQCLTTNSHCSHITCTLGLQCEQSNVKIFSTGEVAEFLSV